MESTPHIVAHFMAAGAEQRLEDYHFLRNTYETVSGQEAQLNRILRMLDEDEINLNWHIDTTPIERARSRSLYDFNRTDEKLYLPGRIAYLRLREMEDEDLKKRPVYPRSSGRRPRLSHQHDQSPLTNGQDSERSAARLRAQAEYEAELAEAERRRKQLRKERETESISFSVRYEDSSSTNAKQNDFGRLVFEWTSPSSLSDISSFVIERQLNGQDDWSQIGESVEKNQTQTQCDVLALFSDQNYTDSPSRFRLKAQVDNGKVFTSQATDEINLKSLIGNRLIIPQVEILSDKSVQLTWSNNENENLNKYLVEKKEPNATEWTRVTKVPLSQGSAQLDDLNEAEQCQFRLVAAAKSDDDNEFDLLTVHNVNEWLSSLRLVPTSASSVDVDISEEGFKQFDRYKVEFTTIDQLDQWQQIPDVTRDVPHLTIDKLKQGTDYKFRFTPHPRGASTSNAEAISSQLALVLDVKTPLSGKDRLKKQAKPPAPPPQFAIHQTDPTTVLIEAIVPSDKPVSFEDVFDVYSKKETVEGGEDWVKIGTIDKDHLNLTMKNLSENTAYVFKIHNQNSPDEENNIIQEFQFETQSVNIYDPSIFLEKVQQSLENVVNGVMRAAAGHQALDDPLHISLNEVIKEIFQDESLVPNEQYGFDTLALSNDLQLFCGPKQMMLQELEGNNTNESSKVNGEIIIHNYIQPGREQQPVIVREENGNTRIGNIDGDVIVRNVVTDVLLINEETRNQLSMNIVGQAFLKSVQGILIASKFKGIIVVKNVQKT